MNQLLQSISHFDGDPNILPFSTIGDQIFQRPNFACGQIKRYHSFGNEIYKLALDTQYKNYMEIGTWCGLGTTKCFLDGIIMRNDNPTLYSYESNKQFYTITKKYWDKFFEIHHIHPSKFNLTHGSIVSYQELDDNYITDSGYDKQNYDYNADIKTAPIVQINHPVDVLCLDGGHFSTIVEWNKLKDSIKVIILDDTKTSQTRNILREIKQSNLWTTLYESHERNGELIAKKI